MKRISFVVAMVILCLSASSVMFGADNPNIGTWNLNVDKSKITPGSLPKSLTRTVSADGDNVKYSYEGTSADGTALAYGFTVKYDGNDNPITGSGMPFGADQIAIKRLGSHSFSSTLKRGGKVVATTKSTVSSDGKTATLTSKGTDQNGKTVSSTLVYDKQ
jgi:hypothetical protein